MHGRPPLRSSEPALLLQKEGSLKVQPPWPGGCRPLCDLLIQHPALQLGSRHLGGDGAGRRVAIAQLHGREIIPPLLYRSLLRGRSRRPTFKHRVLPQPHLPAAIGEGRLLRLHVRPLPQHRRLRRTQQRQQDPVPRRLGAPHGLRRRRTARHTEQAPDPIACKAHTVHADQLLLGTGHGHVQDPHLLRQTLP